MASKKTVSAKMKEEVKEVSPKKVNKKSKLTNMHKVLIVIGVFLLALLLLSSKDLFIAATVNGSPISRLEVVRELEKQGGKQVLDSIVNEKLIIQEARKANIEVSDEEIDAKTEEFREQLTGQGQDLDALLEMQGINIDEFRKQMKIQIYLERLLEDRVNITDEEINEFLETNGEFLPEDKSDEELRELARGELTQQKLSTEFGAWLEEVKANSTINYMVDY